MLGGCSGRLGLDYGKDLCDPEHPCPANFTCADGICVPTAVGDSVVTQTDSGPDRPQGEWDNPNGDYVLPGDVQSCRTDAQCRLGEACVGGFCIATPCAGALCPGEQTCQYRCLATSHACDNNACNPDLEKCVAGSCLPSCVGGDPCALGCNADDPNCIGGHCTNNTLCDGGACVPVMECDKRFCPDGFVCSLSCGTADPCDSGPCNPGWTCSSCERNGCLTSDPNCVAGACTNDTVCVGRACLAASGDLPEDTAVCTENQCSGLACPDGQICISGACQDPCANIACEAGGRYCNKVDGNDVVCCRGECCEPGEMCRDGYCLRGDFCVDGCPANQICEDSDCLCREDPPRLCGGNECCLTKDSETHCIDVCNPNPCADEIQNKFCVRDCNATEGYVCVDGCDSITCALPNTECDPVDAVCKCGDQGQQCSDGQCCVSGQCDNPCDPNPCAGNPQLRGCTRDCTAAEGYTCFDRCASVTCASPTVCDPDSGTCKCGSAKQTCVANQCCVDIGGGDYACDDPCNAPDPCYPLECNRTCGTATGFACEDNCPVGRNCSAETTGRNPNCRGSDNTCWCAAAGAICGANTCCVGSQCKDPCNPNPCGALSCTRDCNEADGYVCVDACVPTDPCLSNYRNPDCRQSGGCWCHNQSADTWAQCNSSQCCNGTPAACTTPCSPNPCTTAPTYRCTVACTASATDYTCSDPCASTNCTSSTAGRNPDCVSQTSGNAQCTCSAAGGAVCTSSQCCQGSGCVDPCTPNPCTTAPNYKCNRDCSVVNDRTCTNPCSGVSCGQPNPTCVPQTDGTTQCLCGGSVCSGTNNICVNGVCKDPCTPDPCDGSTASLTGQCVRDGAQLSGFRCVNNCTSYICAAQNPLCDPKDPNASTRCHCGTNAQTCTGETCCVGSSCVDPCAGDPCGALQCVRDCTKATGRRCVDNCDGYTCPLKNPLCNSEDPVASTRCHCGDYAHTCTGNQCCVTGGCVDACAANPCASNPTNKKCVSDCTQGTGYRCESFCTGVTCNSPLTCDPADGVCGCGATYGACDPVGTPGATSICCGSGGNYACQAPACTTCTGNFLCDPCTGCYCPCEGCC